MTYMHIMYNKQRSKTIGYSILEGVGWEKVDGIKANT